MKKKLIDIGKTQQWLSEEVNKVAGKNYDVKYLNRVLAGRSKSEPMEKSIKDILGMRT